ncbi:MAG: hypothetical protein ACHQW9_01555 [Nitrososphaerales archaeon]
MIICLYDKNFGEIIYDSEYECKQMAEAALAAYGSAIGVGIAFAVVLFALRGKGHPESAE